MTKPGRPRRAPRDRMTLMIPRPIARELRIKARELDREQSALVSQAVSELLERMKQVPQIVCGGCQVPIESGCYCCVECAEKG